MSSLPIGSIVMFDGSTPPLGWYDCDGLSHGGVQTPNLIGKFPKGVPVGGSLGASGGSSTHIHSNDNTGNQSHGHAATSANSSVASSPTVTKIISGTSAYGLDDHQHLISIPEVVDSTVHYHTMPDTMPGNSLPPNIRLRYIMRCE